MTTTDSSMTKRMGILTLTWPIFIETTLRILLGVSDVFMLSGYSDNAVAAVGLTSQLTFFLIIISMMASSGGNILISRYNGAGNHQGSAQVAVICVCLSTAIGLLLGVLAFFGASPVLSLYSLAPAVEQYALEYLLIAGTGIITISLGITFSTILRCHGYAKQPMLINLITGLGNIAGNYCVLYSPFGLPVYGVAGVATVTVVCQLIAAIAMWYMIRRQGIAVPLLQFRQIEKRLYKKTIKLGMLNAGEMLSYNVSQMVMIYFVTQMGTASLTAYTYALNITRLSFTFALSVGQATQIQTGYYMGKQWFSDITERVQRYFVAGLAVSTTVTVLFALFRYDIVAIFTNNPEIAALTAGLMIGSIVLEMGRVANLIIISALRGAGDMAFTVKVGIFSMWGIGVFCAWLFGVQFAFGVIGIWLGTATDEWFRGMIMLRRWRSANWQPPLADLSPNLATDEERNIIAYQQPIAA